MKKLQIPDNTIKRFPVYLNLLDQLLQDEKEVFYSQDLAKYLGIKPSIIRKDLSYLGELGVRGHGYSVEKVRREIRTLLGICHNYWDTVIIGAGNLAKALINYNNEQDINIRVKAAFDIDPHKVGTEIYGVPVLDISEFQNFVKQHSITMVVLAVPCNSVDPTAALIAQTDIKGIINMTPRYLKVPDHIRVIHINITAKIQAMFFYLQQDNISGGNE